MEVEFNLPSEAAFDVVNAALRQQARRFGKRPSELVTTILTGRIVPIRQEKGCLVVTGPCGQPTPVYFDVPSDEHSAIVAAMQGWPEAHEGLSFGDFILNLALGHYDLVEAPKRSNGKRRDATPRCRVCGRPLRSPKAIAKGIGPVCEMKQAA